MSKIYSRPRLKIPKFVVYKNGNKSKKRVNLIIIVFIAFLTFKVVLDAVNPIFDKLCENKAIDMATLISNNKAAEVMKNHTYDELFSTEKDEKGNIIMIKANVISINAITSDLAIKIQEEINRKGKDDIEITLRKFYWTKVFIWKWTYNKSKYFNYW